jgi:hypothetical protein
MLVNKWEVIRDQMHCVNIIEQLFYIKHFSLHETSKHINPQTSSLLHLKDDNATSLLQYYLYNTQETVWLKNMVKKVNKIITAI